MLNTKIEFLYTTDWWCWGWGCITICLYSLISVPASTGFCRESVLGQRNISPDMIQSLYWITFTTFLLKVVNGRNYFQFNKGMHSVLIFHTAWLCDFPEEFAAFRIILTAQLTQELARVSACLFSCQLKLEVGKKHR